VHTWIAVGAPWLGVPKLLRGIISGERMGLNSFLSKKDAIVFARRTGTPNEELYWKNFEEVNLKGKSFVYKKAVDDNLETNESIKSKRGVYVPVNHQKVFQEVGCPEIENLYKRYYLDNPYFGELKDGMPIILHPPPVRRLYNIYGWFHFGSDRECTTNSCRLPQRIEKPSITMTSWCHGVYTGEKEEERVGRYGGKDERG